MHDEYCGASDLDSYFYNRVHANGYTYECPSWRDVARIRDASDRPRLLVNGVQTSSYNLETMVTLSVFHKVSIYEGLDRRMRR